MYFFSLLHLLLVLLRLRLLWEKFWLIRFFFHDIQSTFLNTRFILVSCFIILLMGTHFSWKLYSLVYLYLSVLFYTFSVLAKFRVMLKLIVLLFLALPFKFCLNFRKHRQMLKDDTIDVLFSFFTLLLYCINSPLFSIFRQSTMPVGAPNRWPAHSFDFTFTL